MSLAPTQGGAAAASGVISSPNTQKLSKKQLEKKWESLAVCVIERVAWELSDCREVLNSKKQLSPDREYTVFEGSSFDGPVEQILVFDHQKIKTKFPSPLDASDIERKQVTKLISIVLDIIKNHKYAQFTSEGVFAITALTNAQKISSIQESILCQNLALELIRKESRDHPEYFDSPAASCLVL